MLPWRHYPAVYMQLLYNMIVFLNSPLSRRVRRGCFGYNFSKCDHFRSNAISSILSKILDYIIIDQQAHSLITSDHQFGFKPNSSTVLCTTILVETVQYYDENGRQPVYVLQLDASKAFNRVSYSKLFIVLLDKIVCPYIVRLLCYMCLNQNVCVK